MVCKTFYDGSIPSVTSKFIVMKIILPGIVVLLVSVHHETYSQRQAKLITGIVVADDNSPIEGAMIRIKGTNRHSGSQPDGIYYLEISPSDTALIFTRSGYNPAELKLTGDSEYSIRLTKSVDVPQQVRVLPTSLRRRRSP